MPFRSLRVILPASHWLPARVARLQLKQIRTGSLHDASNNKVVCGGFGKAEKVEY